MTSLADRAVGCVLGLALGDAAGAPFEFRRSHDVPDPVPILELPWGGGPPGSTTDDTAMARNLVHSLSARKRLDPDDLIERHVAWFRTDPPDMGTLEIDRLELSCRAQQEAPDSRSVPLSRRVDPGKPSDTGSIGAN